MRVVLVTFRNDGERRSYSITKEITVIGRRRDCNLRISLSKVSRKHCRLVQAGDELRIEDLGSSNGTFHNGERIRNMAVTAGDRIQIGPVTFIVQIDGQPSDESLKPDLAVPPTNEGIEANADFAISADAAGDQDERSNDLVDFNFD